MAASPIDVFFLPLRDKRRFCVLHTPDSARACGGALVYVHPFAEEMNKSRRVAAVAARKLAAEGWFVLQIDLLGCGDSEGQFGEATWSRWVDDVVDASTWLHERCGCAPTLWGLRLGCLLAIDAARRLDTAADLVFWQPVQSGKQFLQQFLRLKLANQLFGDNDSGRLKTDDLRGQLAQGHAIEVGGYELSPDLAGGLDAAALTPPAKHGRVAWFEVLSTPDVSPATRGRVDAWQSAGFEVDVHAIAGPPFWQTQELAECPALVESTASVLRNWRQ